MPHKTGSVIVSGGIQFHLDPSIPPVNEIFEPAPATPTVIGGAFKTLDAKVGSSEGFDNFINPGTPDIETSFR